uniref:Uncharacterized protein n=1 Tax=Rhizophora mucronata TaxID=61149 RepID=A0A2P2Q634_RHIMU
MVGDGEEENVLKDRIEQAKQVSLAIIHH